MFYLRFVISTFVATIIELFLIKIGAKNATLCSVGVFCYYVGFYYVVNPLVDEEKKGLKRILLIMLEATGFIVVFGLMYMCCFVV